jgi:queuine/archaeosine tRNA-ribosyltransferase
LIAAEVVSSRGAARVLRISKGNKLLTTPAYFPAVSGARGTFAVEELIRLVVSSGYPRLLFSAYDFYVMKRSIKRSITADVSEYFRNGSFVMLDSGIFERFWKRDNDWTFPRFSSSVRQIDSDFYCSFDRFHDKNMPINQFVHLSIRGVASSAKIQENSQVLPVLHGNSPGELIQVFKRVTSAMKSVPIIAVSERDCGKTLSERAGTVCRLRRILNKQGDNTVLHVLGCGNPISVATYTYCGADSFDSLDWSELVIERETLRLYHLSQLELLHCGCPVCTISIKDPNKKALLHNLRFYQDYGSMLRTMIQRGTLRDFLLEYVGKDLLESLTLVEK